jgi:hypothetical protein
MYPFYFLYIKVSEKMGTLGTFDDGRYLTDVNIFLLFNLLGGNS